MPVLARAWQMLLKGLDEVQAAPSPVQAAEMVLVRLAYVADLPVPADLVRSRSTARAQPRRPGDGAPRRTAPLANAAARAMPAPSSGGRRARSRRRGRGRRRRPRLAAADPQAPPRAALDADAAELRRGRRAVRQQREAVHRARICGARPSRRVRAGPDRVRPAEGAPRDLANRLGQLLGEWTGARWLVAVSQAEGAPTLREQEERARARALRNEVAATRWCGRCSTTFPGATIAAVRERFAAGRAGGCERRADEPGAERRASRAEDEA